MEENHDKNLQFRSNIDNNKADEENKNKMSDKNKHSKEEMVTLLIPVIFVMKQVDTPKDKNTDKRGAKNLLNGNRCTQADKNKTSIVQQTDHLLKNAKEKCLCEKCGQLFKSKDVLRQHINTHDPDRPKPHMCQICKKDFLKLTALRSHQRIHTGDTPFVCQTCGKGFKWKTSLRSHMKRHNRPYKRYTCDICGQTFAEKSNVSRHMLIHSGSKPFSCDICGKHFRVKHNLDAHLETHKEERKYVCTVCGKGFKCKSTAMTHEQIHKEDRQGYLCDQCGKSFVLKKTLKQHQLIHTGENLKCLECDLEFPSREEKREHMNIEHKKEQTETNVFKCEQCDKVFQNKLYLKSHYQVHNKDTIYRCTKCPKTFQRLDSFRVHKRLHVTEEKSIEYLCMICSKCFKAPQYVRRHIKTSHPDDYSKTKPRWEGLYEIVRKDQSLLKTNVSVSSDTDAIVVPPQQAVEDLDYFEHILP